MLETRDLEMAALLARHGSFARTARAQGVTVAAVSKRLSALEKRLGLRLFDRSTRRVTLTAEGERLVTEAAILLERMADLEASLLQRRQAASGHVRVNSTLGYGRRVLAPLLAAFARKHPDITLELTLTQGLPSGAELPFDVAVRLGTPRASGLVARRVGENRRILVAAPRYLRGAGTPKALRDLLRHRCLAVREEEQDYTRAAASWTFVGPRGAEAVRVHAPLASNDGESVVAWAVDGLGIALRSEWDVAPLIAAGRLVRVLPDYAAPADVHVLRAGGPHVPPRVKLLVDFLAERLGAAR